MDRCQERGGISAGADFHGMCPLSHYMCSFSFLPEKIMNLHPLGMDDSIYVCLAVFNLSASHMPEEM